MRRFAAVWLACAVALVAVHAPWLRLPYFWDELGQFAPAALDILGAGAWVSKTTAPNAHPPGVPAYLAAVWFVFGYSIPAARIAMLVLAALLLTLTWLLARQLEVPSAWRAPLLLALMPVVFMQSMMTLLDMPAAVFLVLALLLYLRGRHVAGALACVALTMMKETGILVPGLFALLSLRDRQPRRAVIYALSGVPLAMWLGVIARSTGRVLGDPWFAYYNLFFALHPVRVLIALCRRVYTLFCAGFLWIGALALWRARHTFLSRPWPVVLGVAASYTLLVTALGGATLERYLLPVFPVLAVAIAHALRNRVAFALLAAGLAASLWINPWYPFPFENNLAMTDFVSLHRQAGAFLDSTHAGAKVCASWPVTDELRRPEYGYVRAHYEIAAAKEARRCPVLVRYSRLWDPPVNLLRIGAARSVWQAFYGIEEALPEPPGMIREMRIERRGQWIEVWARP